jgi:hypothetical protein
LGQFLHIIVVSLGDKPLIYFAEYMLLLMPTGR